MTIYTVEIVNTHLYGEKLFSVTSNSRPSSNLQRACIFCLIVVIPDWNLAAFTILLRLHSQRRLSKYRNKEAYKEEKRSAYGFQAF